MRDGLYLSETRLVDYAVKEKLHDLALEFAEQNRKLLVLGLERHFQLTDGHTAPRANGEPATEPVST
jgi:hypothetical protein